MNLGIYGAGGQGRELLVLAQIINSSSSRWDDIFFIDDSKEPDIICNKQVLSFKSIIEKYGCDDLEIVIAVGEPSRRCILREKVKDTGYKLTSLVHPSVIIPEGTNIGEGTVICCNCFVSCNVTIGDNVLIQPLASIAHDSFIGSDTVISTFVCIAGGCTIGNETYIGMNVPVREKVVIGNQSIIGMGSVVTKDIPDKVIAYGYPARVKKENTNHKVFKAKK